MEYTPNGPGWTPMGGGGGIYIESSSHPVITNNIITENESGFLGGGIACMKSTPTITGNTITKNKVSLFGGAGIIVWECTGTFLIQDNIISENKGHEALYVLRSSPTIKGNTITDNKCTGICLSDSSSTVSGNTITGNKENYSDGAGIYITDSSPTITGNTISNNSSAYNGGGISISGGPPLLPVILSPTTLQHVEVAESISKKAHQPFGTTPSRVIGPMVKEPHSGIHLAVGYS